MSQRFYINWPLAPGPVELTGHEAHHLANVRRLRAGDEVCLFNGDGHEYLARVVATSRRDVCLDITSIERVDRELDFLLEVAAPLPKGDRAQFLVEKLTELGVARFVPLNCAHAVVHPGERTIDKLQRYVIEASKQCGRNVLMQIAEPVDWASYCHGRDPMEVRVVAHPKAASPGATSSAGRWTAPIQAGTTVRCAVGPEGGLADEEIETALAEGWQLLNLGPRILRLETAAMMVAMWAISTSGSVPAEGQPGLDRLETE